MHGKATNEAVFSFVTKPGKVITAECKQPEAGNAPEYCE